MVGQPTNSGCCCCGRPSPRGSSTSTWKRTSPRRCRGSARPSGSSVSMTSARTPDDLEAIHRRLGGAGPRHHQAGHHGQPSGRQLPHPPPGGKEPHPHRRLLHGRHRHPLADPRRPLRRAVHLRHLHPRAGAGARSAQLRRDDRGLPVRSHQPPDGDLLRDRRSRGTQPQPPDPQRGLPAPAPEQDLRALPGAQGGLGPLHRRGPEHGHQGAQRHHPPQGSRDREAHRG